MSRGTLLWGLVAVVAFTILIQFIPFPGLGKDPPVVAEPAWNSTATRALAVRACYDCHSNKTRWPWYSRIAPVSWLVAHHVSEGRAALNFSDPNASRFGADRAARAVLDHAMPPFYYTWLHPRAALSAAERKTLAAGLRASLPGAPTSTR
jgi:mono/diheme cytochrome c family protein